MMRQRTWVAHGWLFCCLFHQPFIQFHQRAPTGDPCKQVQHFRQLERNNCAVAKSLDTSDPDGKSTGFLVEKFHGYVSVRTVSILLNKLIDILNFIRSVLVIRHPTEIRSFRPFPPVLPRDGWHTHLTVALELNAAPWLIDPSAHRICWIVISAKFEQLNEAANGSSFTATKRSLQVLIAFSKSWSSSHKNIIRDVSNPWLLSLWFKVHVSHSSIRKASHCVRLSSNEAKEKTQHFALDKIKWKPSRKPPWQQIMYLCETKTQECSPPFLPANRT